MIGWSRSYNNSAGKWHALMPSMFNAFTREVVPVRCIPMPKTFTLNVARI